MGFGALVQLGFESDPELFMGYVLRATLLGTLLGVVAHGMLHLLTHLLRALSALAHHRRPGNTSLTVAGRGQRR